MNPAGQKLDIHHPDTSGLFSLERRRREAHCPALRIWRHCHNIDVKLIPLLNAADQLPTECKNHSDTTDYCHIVTCHPVITHGAEEELCECCHHCAVIMTTWHWSAPISWSLTLESTAHCPGQHCGCTTEKADTPRHPVCVTRHHPAPPRIDPYFPCIIFTSATLHTIMTWSHFTQWVIFKTWRPNILSIFKVLSNFTTDVKYTHKN